jgi:hypothetical protein
MDYERRARIPFERRNVVIKREVFIEGRKGKCCLDGRKDHVMNKKD